MLNVIEKDHCKDHPCNINFTVCKNNPAKDKGYECVCKSCNCSTGVSGIGVSADCTLGRCLTCVIMLCHNNCLGILYSPHHVGHGIVKIMHCNYTRMHSK